MLIGVVLIAVMLEAGLGNDADATDLATINETCHDYIDGQFEGDPDRVARSLHPDLSKRAAIGSTEYERYALRRMTKEELVDLTKRGALKMDNSEWDRSCSIVDIAGNIAVVRLETPWFIDHLQMAKFDGQWLIVNALWYMKPSE